MPRRLAEAKGSKTVLSSFVTGSSCHAREKELVEMLCHCCAFHPFVCQSVGPKSVENEFVGLFAPIK